MDGTIGEEPDKDIIGTILGNIQKSTEMRDQITLLTECFTYLTQFVEFLAKIRKYLMPYGLMLKT